MTQMGVGKIEREGMERIDHLHAPSETKVMGQTDRLVSGYFR